MQPSEVTPAMIATLRSMIDEPLDEDPYTDAALAQRIASADGILGAAAYYAWRDKAATLSSLVDITEGGSTRKNSQAHAAALDMATAYQPYVPVTDPINAYHGPTSQTRAIVRP